MPRSAAHARAGRDRPSLYQEITDKIIAELEAGRVPWVQPWGTVAAKASLTMPKNATTQRQYSGINVLILWCAVIEHGFSTQNWLTFRQALGLGAHVRKGEHGTTVVYADRFVPDEERRRAERDGDEPNAIPFLKRFTVFNTDQCESLPPELTSASAPVPGGLILPHAEALIAATGADFRIGGDRAFYNTVHDFIQVPRPEDYFESINWHRTALHELGHWSGHPSRLGRDLSGNFGSMLYAKEELVAEMTSAFVCASLGIVPTVRHADYIGSWLEVLRDDDRTIVRAASAASKAADYLLAFRPEVPAVIADGLLSDAQLESVIYAGEAHAGYLAGSWTVDDTFDVVPAAPDDAENRFRRGSFLDGAGKGRQVAGILLDNWLKGRRRAVWISKSDKLIEDAQRDWSALGQERLLITPPARFRQGTSIRLDQAILFTTYATLRSDAREEKVSRVRQIVDWLGRDLDGVIVFDESHAMQNAAREKFERGERAPSQQGRAGLRLQHALPNARVLHVSATGATSVHNLAYAQRLGLCGGADFPFATRAEFVEAIEAGGVAAMEVLARDLKALGRYAARSLSFDGIEYELIEHQLTSEQIRTYDAYAAAFQVIHNNLNAALQAANVTGETGTPNSQVKSAARSAFESAKQRFFNHLITAMKTGTGRSYHADLAARNHRLRVHYLLWRRLGLVGAVRAGSRLEGRHRDPRPRPQLQHGLELRRVRVMGESRVELSGFTDGMVDRLKAMGLISEIISWKLRLLVPTGSSGPTILAKLMEGHPPVRVADKAAA